MQSNNLFVILLEIGCSQQVFVCMVVNMFLVDLFLYVYWFDGSIYDWVIFFCAINSMHVVYGCQIK